MDGPGNVSRDARPVGGGAWIVQHVDFTSVVVGLGVVERRKADRIGEINQRICGRRIQDQCMAGSCEPDVLPKDPRASRERHGERHGDARAKCREPAAATVVGVGRGGRSGTDDAAQIDPADACPERPRESPAALNLQDAATEPDFACRQAAARRAPEGAAVDRGDCGEIDVGCVREREESATGFHDRLHARSHAGFDSERGFIHVKKARRGPCDSATAAGADGVVVGACQKDGGCGEVAASCDVEGLSQTARRELYGVYFVRRAGRRCGLAAGHACVVGGGE